MGKHSGIQWTHHTFNPWWGCEKVTSVTAERHRCEPAPPIASLARCPATRPALRQALGFVVTEAERQEREGAELRAIIERWRAAYRRRPLPEARGWAGMGRGAGI